MSTQTFESWVGREESRNDRLHASTIAAMAATLDLDATPAPGEPVPPGWHWLFFNPAARRGELGVDGHPARGGFLPPVALPRRMWAGSRIRYLHDLPVDAEATRRSRILKVENKSGKRGALCFVTVEHTTSHGRTPCIVEEQDIVYREPTPPGAAPPPPPARHPAEPQWVRDEVADTTLLFRYSALTFNGHRIHYDETYARDEEGYPCLVVHGPLTATLLQMFAREHGGRPLAEFDFRGVAPLFANRPFRLEAREQDADTLEVWARGPAGELAMSAVARLR
ncbi:FAS1-like dehydratase domain-containing protein [Luteimonas sp. A537]